MATETELYQQILTNLGVDCNSLPDLTLTTLLTAIAQNCGGGGGGSAGGGVFDVVVSLQEDETTYKADKTVAECIAAHKAGKILRVFVKEYGTTNWATIAWIDEEDGWSCITFNHVQVGSSLGIKQFYFQTGQGGADEIYIGESKINIDEHSN